MTDTPEHIKELQLKIWLQKSPGERLRRAIEDNEALYLAWKTFKEKQDTAQAASDADTTDPKTPETQHSTR